MIKKGIAGLLVAGVLCTFLTSCSTSNNQLIKNAVKNLENLQDDYQISNVLQAPEGSLCYVEIVNGDISYTEYPVDKDGNYGAVSYQDITEETEYVLTDWITGELGYTYVNDESWVSFPSSYTKLLKNRDTMYMNLLVSKLKDVKYVEDTTLDIGMGSETMQVYTAKLKSEDVKTILGMNTLNLYKSIKSSSDDSNIDKLCDYYIDDVDFSLVFSDGNLTLGVIDGVLRYFQLEVGGLGSRLYLTKCVLMNDVTLRETPDFSNVVKYEDTLKELADYVSGYDSFEDALAGLESDSTESEESTNSDEESSEEVNSDENSSEQVSEDISLDGSVDEVSSEN